MRAFGGITGDVLGAIEQVGECLVLVVVSGLASRHDALVGLTHSVAMAHWLLKSEPDEFGYDDLVRVGREGWDGVRNYTARIHLRAMKVGDEAIFYHSNAKPPGAAGICKIVKAAEPDPTQFDPDQHVLRPRIEARGPALGLGRRSPPCARSSASCRSTSCARCPSSRTANCWPAATACP